MSTSRPPLAGRTVGLALVLAACSGDSAVPLDRMPTEFAGVVCDRSFECCSADELEGKTSATCKSNTAAALTLLVAPINDSQAKGRVRYHGDKLGQCLDAMRKIPCAQWSSGLDENPPAGCEAWLEPLVADGGACAQDFDCKGGNCEGADQSKGTEGKCQALPGPGAACTGSCGKGDYCDHAKSPSVCAAQKADGMACLGSDECTSGGCTGGKCGPKTGGSGGSCYAGCSMGGRRAPVAWLLALGLIVAASLTTTSLRPRHGGRR